MRFEWLYLCARLLKAYAINVALRMQQRYLRYRKQQLLSRIAKSKMT